MFKLKWKRNEAQYAMGHLCMAGKIKVGSVFQPSVSKGTVPPWRAAIDLPGIRLKAEAKDFATVDEAKACVERVVATWSRWTQEDV